MRLGQAAASLCLFVTLYGVYASQKWHVYGQVKMRAPALVFGKEKGTLSTQNQEAEYLCTINNTAIPKVMNLEFRLKTNGDPVNRLVAMIDSAFATSRVETSEANCPTIAGNRGGNWRLTDSIPFSAGTTSICGGKADNTPDCVYWVIKAERYADFNSFYDCYYAIKCCASDAVNIYQQVDATIGEVHIQNQPYNPVVATLSFGHSGPQNLGNLNFLTIRINFNNTTNVEGLSAYGAYITGRGCRAYDPYDTTKTALIVDGNGCGTGNLPFQLAVNQQAFTFDSTNTTPAVSTPNDFLTANFEIHSFETIRLGPHVVTVECQIAFCYNSTDPRCFNGNTCATAAGRRRRRETDNTDEIQTVNSTIIINTGLKNEKNVDDSCMEIAIFVSVIVVFALLILMASALTTFLYFMLRSRKKCLKNNS